MIWVNSPPVHNKDSPPKQTRPTNSAGFICSWCSDQEELKEEHSLNFLFWVFISLNYITMHVRSFFPYAFEGFAAHEGNLFYGHVSTPIFTSRPRPVRGLEGGHMQGGSRTHDVRFTDEDPLVIWLSAILEGRDASHELHNQRPDPDANVEHDGHHARGLMWLIGESTHGPYINQHMINAQWMILFSSIALR